MCVNALNGLFPFLPDYGGSLCLNLTGVNALNGLFPFLLYSYYAKKSQSTMCVNALNGLFPFLPVWDDKSIRLILYRGVNALNGLFPFLLS